MRITQESGSNGGNGGDRKREGKQEESGEKKKAKAAADPPPPPPPHPTAAAPQPHRIGPPPVPPPKPTGMGRWSEAVCISYWVATGNGEKLSSNQATALISCCLFGILCEFLTNHPVFHTYDLVQDVTRSLKSWCLYA